MNEVTKRAGDEIMNAVDKIVVDTELSNIDVLNVLQNLTAAYVAQTPVDHHDSIIVHLVSQLPVKVGNASQATYGEQSLGCQTSSGFYK